MNYRVTNKFLKHTPILVFLFLSADFISGQNNDTVQPGPIASEFKGDNSVDSAIVYVSFIVDTSGTISDIKVIKTKCKKCSKKYKKNIKKEAMRVVSKMPEGKSHKERVKFILPIKFILEKESRQ